MTVEYIRDATSGLHSCASPAVEHARRDLRHVIGGLAEAIAGIRVGRSLPEVFEQGLRQLLPIRAVRLREVPASYNARLVTPTRTSDSIVLDVPTSDPSRQAVLEASFERGGDLTPESVAVLGAAAMLGALVLAAERSR